MCANNVTSPSPSMESVVAAIPLGCEAGAVAVTNESVWVVPHLDRVMLRIDPNSNQVVDRVPLGDRGPGAEIDATDDMVWASVSSPAFDLERLVRVDPSSAEVVASVDLAVASPVIAGGFVWATDSEGQIFRIDPDTNAVNETDFGGCRLLSDDTRLWCIGPEVALTIDTNTGQATDLTTGERLEWPVVAAWGLIWGTTDDVMWALDPTTGVVVQRLEPPTDTAKWGLEGVVLDDELWLTANSGGFDGAPDLLVRIDRQTLEMECLLETPNPEFGIASGHGSIWYPVVREPWLLRIEPVC